MNTAGKPEAIKKLKAAQSAAQAAQNILTGMAGREYELSHMGHLHRVRGDLMMAEVTKLNSVIADIEEALIRVKKI